MKKKTIVICPKGDFPSEVIGIRYEGNHYHLAWQMNESLNINLSDFPKVHCTNKNGRTDVFFLFGEENGKQYRFLFKNKGEQHLLFPGLKNFDFFYIQLYDYEYDTEETARKIFELPGCLFSGNLILNRRQRSFLYQILFQNPQENYDGNQEQGTV